MKLMINEIIDGKISLKQLKKLTKEDQTIILSHLYNLYQSSKNKADKLTRSILRHDSKKLAKTILKFI